MGQPSFTVDVNSLGGEGETWLMTAAELKRLQGMGLQLASWKQLGQRHEFELPCRPGQATLLKSVDMGLFSYVGPQSELRSCSIGRFCSIAANVAIGPAEHPVDWVTSHPVGYAGMKHFKDSPLWQLFEGEPRRFEGNGGETKIGHDVWIGRNVVIRQGVVIGDGAIIAANSFVNKDVAPYSIVGGSPAKVIRMRHSDVLIERLLAARWWDWAIEAKKNGLDYRQPEQFVNRLEELLQKGMLMPLRAPVLELRLAGEQKVVVCYRAAQRRPTRVDEVQ